jgi:hypothetical protein
MNYALLSELRRTDLTLSERQVEVQDVIDDACGFERDRIVLLQPVKDRFYAGAPMQAVMEVDDYCPCDACGASYVYVPLAFGPVQEDAL